jgi:hypothetical protein
MTEASPSVEELVGLMPHAVAMGIALDRAAAEEVRGSVGWAPDRCTVGGALHAGGQTTQTQAVLQVAGTA